MTFIDRNEPETPFDDFLRNTRDATRGSAVLSLEDNPDDAATAMKLAQVTGTPPALVYGDLENFQAQHRAAVTSELVANNPELQEYVRSHALAAKVSNDDYGQLDVVSGSLKNMFGADFGMSQSTVGSFAKRFKEGFGTEPIGSWITKTPEGQAFARRYPASAYLYYLEGAAIEIPARTFTGLLSGLEGILQHAYPGDEMSKQRFARELTGMAEYVLMGQSGLPIKQDVLMDSINRLEPWLRAGKEPPPGIHEVVDKAKGEQAKVDKDLLADALKESVASATRERSPELFEGFVRQHTDAEIGIPGDAVRALYGDKVPAPDDGLLGWVPGIQEKLSAAEATGGDVQIPLASWLAQVEPDVAKALQDHVRFRKDGLTVEEAKVGIEPPQIPVQGEQIPIVSALREANRLEPQGVPQEPAPMRARPEQLEMAEATRMEDREPFQRGAAIGMTQVQYERYQKLIEQRLAEDRDWLLEKATRDARRKQTAEWKENAAAIRKDVVEEFKALPDVAADAFFREGKLLDQKISPLPKLDSALLTDEQKAALGKEYHAKGGLAPDDAAALLGYDSGAFLIDGLAKYAERRKAAGMGPIAFSRRLIDAEVERRMQEKFGNLQENIIEEAKERVLSETQIEMLHEETLAAAADAGLEFSIPKEQFKRALADRFEEYSLSAADSAKLLADAGRANRLMEMALLKGDPAEAFRQKQRAYIATTLAKEAMGVEAAREKLDASAKRFGNREVKGVAQDSLNYIQKLLGEADYPLKVSAQEIASNIAHEGTGTLTDFVEGKRYAGWEPAVSDTLQELGAKPIDQMTVAEFRDFKDAIDSLAYIGREEQKILIAGEKEDFADFKAKVLTNIREMPPRPRAKQGRWIYAIDASLTRMEEIVKDLDLREELGPLYRAVIEPMMASKSKEFDLLTDLSRHFREVKGDFGKKWRKSLGDSIPQDFIIDPYTMVPYDLSRENLIQIMLNWGNRSNIEKFSRGYASLELGHKATREEAFAFEAKTKALIDRHATKEDWDFVKQMWEPFKKWQKEQDVVARNVSGVSPKWIEPTPVLTPHGLYDGGYWPVKYDRLGSDLSVIEDKKPPDTALFGKNYFRASTAKGNLKERTGYIDAVDINTSIEQAAGVMQQSIHDIAFRDAVMQTGKVFYDKEIRAAIRKHYGTEYEAQLVPWLKRVANKFAGDEQATKAYNDWLRRTRVNLIGHALPLNLKVILSPDIGVPDPIAWSSFEANRSDNVKLAMEQSKEIKHLVYNMDRDYREHLERATAPRGTMGDIQRKAMDWGFKPMMVVSQEFRMATFVDQFNKAKAKGLTDHEASVVADSFVRERHGAASIVDLPAIMESSEAMKMLTMFYGYFNTMYNWQRQLPGNWRQGRYKDFAVNGLGSVIVGAGFGAALFNNAKEGDSWWKTMAKAVALQPLQTVPIVRDFANYFIEGFSPRSPMATVIGGLSAAVTEAKHVVYREPTKRPIQAAANVIGLATGLPMLQLGRTGQFLYDVNAGKQRPRNILEWTRGIIHGEARLKQGRQ